MGLSLFANHQKEHQISENQNSSHEPWVIVFHRKCFEGYNRNLAGDLKLTAGGLADQKAETLQIH